MIFRRGVFRWAWLPQPRRRLESPPPLLGPQAQLPRKWKRPAVERRLFWGRKWFPKQRRKLCPPGTATPPQQQLPCPHKRAQRVLPAHFWRKKWRPRPRPRNRSIAPAGSIVTPTFQDIAKRRIVHLKREVFRWKWFPRLVLRGTPFIPPPPPDPIVATFKPRRMALGVKLATFWKKKPARRPRKKYNAPTTLVPSTRTTLEYRSYHSWRPPQRRRKQQVIASNGVPSVVSLARALWTVTGNAPVVNGKSFIALATVAWHWAASGVRIGLRLGQVSWTWNTRSVAINKIILGQAQWHWNAQAPSVTLLWQKAPHAGGSWSKKNKSSGIWSKVNPRGGSWTKR